MALEAGYPLLVERLTLTSGTFDLANNNATIDGDCDLNGGALANLAGGVWDIAGDFTSNGVDLVGGAGAAMNVLGSATAHDCIISNMDFSGGTALDATDGCTDGGGNTNVTFVSTTSVSLVTSCLTAALLAMSRALAETLRYRTSHSSPTWVVLSGFVLDRDDIIVPQFDGMDHAEHTVRTARLSGPASPAMALGYELKDGNGVIWAVETVEFDQQQLCGMRRTTVANASPNRGGAS